jgi:putative membrane protein insertion efficiency factor
VPSQTSFEAGSVKILSGWRRVRLLILLLVAATVGFDVTRPPSAQWSAAAAVAGIRGYQAAISPILGGMGVQCRFEPSCSRYAVAAITKFGILKGGWRAVGRIARCGPWTPRGTVDLP